MNYYDYTRGLKAPYSLQVIKTPKGKIVWVFAQPIGLSYFIALFFCVMIAVSFLYFVYTFPVILGFNFNILFAVVLPHKLAKWYAESEIDGKNGLMYVRDFLIYFKDFVLNQKAIYRFERVPVVKEFSFKR